jgi:hypothetical protein
LTAGTKYYVRAYATNSAGTSYGNEISFTTLSLTKPTLTTSIATSITATSVTIGGSISSDGYLPITQSGVCYSTSSGPTILNSRTTDGTASGSFTSKLSGLTAGTKYYVRAYATNSAGTSYGNEISFTTNLPCNITSNTTGVWFSMSTSSATSYLTSSNYTITFTSPIYNYSIGQVTKVSIFLNETEVHNYGSSITFSNGVAKSFSIPNLSTSSCYTIRVFKVESGGLTKVYVSPSFKIN